MPPAGLLRVRIAAIVASCSAASCSQPDPYMLDARPSGTLDAGGSGALDPVEVGRDAPTSAICDPDYSRVAGLHLPEPVDYLAWDYSGKARAEAGKPCRFADDHEACGSALAAIREEASTSVAAATHLNGYYLYTRGNEVGLLLSDQEILEFLGPLDTVNEAAIVLSLRYGIPRCETIRVVVDGYVTDPRFLERGLIPWTAGNCEVTGYFEVHVSYDGTTTERQTGTGWGVCPGRRPSGLLQAAHSAPNLAVGAHFARVAELELAAVAAFAEIERALRAHAAPARLVERCRAARRDEVRHAALMTELACRYGAMPEPVRFVPKASHTLLELALENAREGLSREFFAAAVAAWQSRSAGSLDTRARFAEIAREEAEHAQLSLDLAAWLSERLSDEERALVTRERERSFQELEQELDVAVGAELIQIAGVPNAADAQRLLRAVRAELT